MESATPLIVSVSPSSEEKLWGKLRDRVDTILEQRKPNHSPSADLGVESERSKRRREDSLLLIRGFDSAVSSLSQLNHTLDAAQQGLHDLVKRHPTEIEEREISQGTEEAGDEQPNAKRHCSLDDNSGVDVGKSVNLNKAKNLAVAMAGKATSLAKELKIIKSQLCFMQERCGLLEDQENKRIRDGIMDKCVRGAEEEDDLVRLQLETLLAEKSRLANENAKLIRENECLHQLVEYHQLAGQDLSSPTYNEETICGLRLDFEDENNCAYTPKAADKLEEEEMP